MSDWSLPTIASEYQVVIDQLRGRDDDAATMFSGSASINLPVNAIKFDLTAGNFKKWNGTAWVDAVSAYNLPTIVAQSLQVVGATNFKGDVTCSGNLNVAGGNVATKQYVDDEIAKIPIPQTAIVGEIRMFTAVTNLPKGWYICDGSNDTPNLRDRFIIGAGDKVANGATAGSFAITKSNMPNHDHGGDLSSNTDPESNPHTHSGATASDGKHAHNLPNPAHVHGGGFHVAGVGSWNIFDGDAAYGGGANVAGATPNLGSTMQDDGHTHKFTSDNNTTQHTHHFNAVIKAEGGSQDYLQPCYAVVFAMFKGA